MWDRAGVETHFQHRCTLPVGMYHHVYVRGGGRKRLVSRLGEGKPKMNPFCDFFFQHEIYTLFIYFSKWNNCFLGWVRHWLCVSVLLFVWVFLFGRRWQNWSQVDRASLGLLIFKNFLGGRGARMGWPGQKGEEDSVLSAASLGDQNQFQLHFVQVESQTEDLIFNTSDGFAGKLHRHHEGECACVKGKTEIYWLFFFTAAPVV